MSASSSWPRPRSNGSFFELPYESRDDLRDTFWKQAVAEAGFQEYRQLTISPEALAYILPSLTGITSTRRLTATAGTGERPFIGAVESD
jgi:dCMP deaminase